MPLFPKKVAERKKAQTLDRFNERFNTSMQEADGNAGNRGVADVDESNEFARMGKDVRDTVMRVDSREDNENRGKAGTDTPAAPQVSIRRKTAAELRESAVDKAMPEEATATDSVGPIAGGYKMEDGSDIGDLSFIDELVGGAQEELEPASKPAAEPAPITPATKSEAPPAAGDDAELAKAHPRAYAIYKAWGGKPPGAVMGAGVAALSFKDWYSKYADVASKAALAFPETWWQANISGLVGDAPAWVRDAGEGVPLLDRSKE